MNVQMLFAYVVNNHVTCHVTASCDPDAGVDGERQLSDVQQSVLLEHEVDVGEQDDRSQTGRVIIIIVLVLELL